MSSKVKKNNKIFKLDKCLKNIALPCLYKTVDSVKPYSFL